MQLYAFDILALDGEDLRGLPLSLRKTNLARLLARRPDVCIVNSSGALSLSADLILLRSSLALPRHVIAKAHAIAVPLHAKPVAVVFHFMEPIRAVWNAGRLGGQAKLKGTKHPLKIGI